MGQSEEQVVLVLKITLSRIQQNNNHSKKLVYHKMA
jgi:hypothetical protein